MVPPSFSFASCAPINPSRMDMTIANATPKPASNRALVRHHEEVAKAMRLRAQDLKAHCRTLISSDEQAAAANMSMTKVHSQIAKEAP